MKSCRTNQCKSMTQTKPGFSSFSCSNIGNQFYAISTVTIHTIIMFTTVTRMRALMRSLIYDLNENISQTLERRQESLNSAEVQKILVNSRYFVTNQFSSSIALLVFSALFLICFAVTSFFKTGNLANDNIQLGDDLVAIDNIKYKKVRSSFN